MKLYGKVIETNPKERIIKIKSSKTIRYLYLQRKDFKEFGPYFFRCPYLFVEVKEKRKNINNLLVCEVLSFVRIVMPNKRSNHKRKVYYDLDIIKKGVLKIVNKSTNRLFLDLEFNMPPFVSVENFISEIIQYGLVLEDKKGNIILEDFSLVKPKKPLGITDRTLKFLKLKLEDFNYACSYKKFYDFLNYLIKKYNPKIYVWGRSDILMLESSFKTNKLEPIDIRSNHINLMQLIKNYYNIKEEIGLFQIYNKYLQTEEENQRHNAFEDAFVTREVFNFFRSAINKK